MKSKAILILPPSNYDFDKEDTPSWEICRVPPVGLLAIATYLHSKGHKTKIIDCRELIVEKKTNNYIPLILKEIDGFNPKVVGLNILTAVFYEAKKIVEAIKERYPDILIVAGGPHPSVESELTLKQIPGIDAICVGQGEEIMLDIVAGKRLKRIEGLMIRGYEKMFVPRPPVMDIDRYPVPNYELTNYKFYTEFSINTFNEWGFKGLSLLTARSCPYSCKFCASDWSKPVKFHSPEYIVRMVKSLSKYDIDVIMFFDDTMAIIKDRLYKMCELFIKEKLFYPYTSLRWYAAMRANQINAEAMGLLKRAGCIGLNIGIETGSDRMLEKINKRITAETNRKACECVKKAGLSLGTSFMIGIPDETEGDMRQTFDFIKKYAGNTVGMGVFRPLPGSPFYYEFLKSGQLKKEEIDWDDIGNFSIPSDITFHQVPRKRFEKIWNEAVEVAYGNHWTAVTEDILRKYPEKIKEIAQKKRVKIARKDNYEASTHTPYIPFGLTSVFNVLKYSLRSIMPEKLKAEIRLKLKKLK